MKKTLFSILLMAVTISFNGCGGSTHSCGNGCTEAKVLDLSECGGFSDRDSHGLDFSKERTYVAYDFNDKSKTITLTHYNVAIGCDVNYSSNTVGSSWLGPISINYGSLAYSRDCYCLRDIKTEIKLSHPIKKFIQYPIEIEDKRKGVIDPEISFVIDSDNNKTGVVSFARANPPWKSCEVPVTLQNSTVKHGVKMELNITRCEIENQPIKIRAVVTNENSYPVLYEMSNIGDPAIYTSVLNQHFSTKKPSNKNDSVMGELSLNYANISAGEKVVRETIWNNTLPSGLIAPNGEYNVTTQFHYVGNADEVDINNPAIPNPIKTGINIIKQHAEIFITPDEAFEKVLNDMAVKSWLDAHDGILCLNFSKGNVLKYDNGAWIKSKTITIDDYNGDQTKECQMQLKEDKIYHFSVYDKYHIPSRISRKIDALKGTP